MTPNVGPMGRAGSKVPKGYKQFQLKQFDPMQEQLYQDQFQHVNPQSYLGRLAGGDQSAFAEQEEPAMRQFSALQGNIGSRFSGMGTGGRHSSGFQNTMNQASQNFASDLAAKRMDTRMKAIQELMGFSNQLLGQRPYETGLVEKPQQGGFFSALGGGLGQAIPGAIGGFFTGGPAGAALGAAGGMIGGAGNAISNRARPQPSPYIPQSGNYNFPNFMDRG